MAHTDCRIIFHRDDQPEPVSVIIPLGTSLSKAAQLGGIDIFQPCGGQGRCGRCAVQVKAGKVHHRSTLQLTTHDLDQGFVLACQTGVESDLEVVIPAQEKLVRHLATDRVNPEITVPADYKADRNPSIRGYHSFFLRHLLITNLMTSSLANRLPPTN